LVSDSSKIAPKLNTQVGLMLRSFQKTIHSKVPEWEQARQLNGIPRKIRMEVFLKATR